VTETSTPPPTPENDNITSASSSSPWVMAVSMLLLISGLILSSAMLMHYATDGREGAAMESTFDFARLMEKGKEFSAKALATREQAASGNKPPSATDSKSADSVVKKFFSGRGNGTVRWPKLKLTGFGTPVDGEVGFAIINGQHVVMGGTVDGATLVKILDYGVLLEYKGETKTIIVEVTR